MKIGRTLSEASLPNQIVSKFLFFINIDTPLTEWRLMKISRTKQQQQQHFCTHESFPMVHMKGKGKAKHVLEKQVTYSDINPYTTEKERERD
jgi:hypothetical protein